MAHWGYGILNTINQITSFFGIDINKYQKRGEGLDLTSLLNKVKEKTQSLSGDATKALSNLDNYISKLEQKLLTLPGTQGENFRNLIGNIKSTIEHKINSAKNDRSELNKKLANADLEQQRANTLASDIDIQDYSDRAAGRTDQAVQEYNKAIDDAKDQYQQAIDIGKKYENEI